MASINKRKQAILEFKRARKTIWVKKDNCDHFKIEKFTKEKDKLRG